MRFRTPASFVAIALNKMNIFKIYYIGANECGIALEQCEEQEMWSVGNVIEKISQFGSDTYIWFHFDFYPNARSFDLILRSINKSHWVSRLRIDGYNGKYPQAMFRVLEVFRDKRSIKQIIFSNCLIVGKLLHQVCTEYAVVKNVEMLTFSRENAWEKQDFMQLASLIASSKTIEQVWVVGCYSHKRQTIDSSSFTELLRRNYSLKSLNMAGYGVAFDNYFDVDQVLARNKSFLKVFSTLQDVFLCFSCIPLPIYVVSWIVEWCFVNSTFYLLHPPTERRQIAFLQNVSKSMEKLILSRQNTTFI